MLLDLQAIGALATRKKIMMVTARTKVPPGFPSS
jgi:hypothetical protein